MKKAPGLQLSWVITRAGLGDFQWCSCLWVIPALVSNPNKLSGSPSWTLVVLYLRFVISSLSGVKRHFHLSWESFTHHTDTHIYLHAPYTLTHTQKAADELSVSIVAPACGFSTQENNQDRRQIDIICEKQYALSSKMLGGLPHLKEEERLI